MHHGETCVKHCRDVLLSTPAPLVPCGCTVVYFLVDQGTVVYVGRTKHLYLRIAQHQLDKSKTFDSFYFVRTNKPHLLEGESIRALQPKYNTILKTGEPTDPAATKCAKIRRSTLPIRTIARKNRTSQQVILRIKQSPRQEALKITRALLDRNGIATAFTADELPPYVILRAHGRYQSKVPRRDGTRPSLGTHASPSGLFEMIRKEVEANPNDYTERAVSKIHAWAQANQPE